MNHRRTSKKSGTTLIEVMVSCVLLGAFATAVIPATMRIARQRLVHRESLIAQHELMNQMERLSMLTDEQLRLATVEISSTHDQLLPEARLQLQVHEQPDTPDRIELTLRWTNRLGVRSKPHVLVGWAAPPAPSENPREASP